MGSHRRTSFALCYCAIKSVLKDPTEMQVSSQHEVPSAAAAAFTQLNMESRPNETCGCRGLDRNIGWGEEEEEE